MKESHTEKQDTESYRVRDITLCGGQRTVFKQELVFSSFPYVGPGDLTQVFRLGSRCHPASTPNDQL